MILLSSWSIHTVLVCFLTLALCSCSQRSLALSTALIAAAAMPCCALLPSNALPCVLHLSLSPCLASTLVNASSPLIHLPLLHLAFSSPPTPDLLTMVCTIFRMFQSTVTQHFYSSWVVCCSGTGNRRQRFCPHGPAVIGLCHLAAAARPNAGPGPSSAAATEAH